MDNLKRGNLSEATAIKRLLELEYTVYTPFGGGTKADLIFEKNGKLLKVQVKTGRTNSRGQIAFRACAMKGNKRISYTNKDVDCFIVVHRDMCYLLYNKDISSPEQYLTINYTKKQKNMKLAKDYIL